MPIIQKDPSQITGSAGGSTSAGTGLSNREKIGAAIIAVLLLALFYFKG